MRKILSTIICFIMIISLGGCKDSATKAVDRYMEKYTSLDANVLSDMKAIIDKESLEQSDAKTYEDIFKKQYSDLTYKIENEEYNGDEATISVKIKVYDLHKSQKESTKYLTDHPEEFNDTTGKYDSNKFIKYKLDKMKNTTDTTEYTIDFYVIKTKDGWTISELSNADLEKIHGIYDYES